MEGKVLTAGNKKRIRIGFLLLPLRSAHWFLCAKRRTKPRQSTHLFLRYLNKQITKINQCETSETWPKCVQEPLVLWQRAGDHQFLLVNIWGANLESLSSPSVEKKKKDVVKSVFFYTSAVCSHNATWVYAQAYLSSVWWTGPVSVCLCVFQLFQLTGLTVVSCANNAALIRGLSRPLHTPCIMPQTCDSVKQTHLVCRRLLTGNFQSSF